MDDTPTPQDATSDTAPEPDKKQRIHIGGTKSRTLLWLVGGTALVAIAIVVFAPSWFRAAQLAIDSRDTVSIATWEYDVPDGWGVAVYHEQTDALIEEINGTGVVAISAPATINNPDKALLLMGEGLAAQTDQPVQYTTAGPHDVVWAQMPDDGFSNTKASQWFAAQPGSLLYTTGDVNEALVKEFIGSAHRDTPVQAPTTSSPGTN